MTEINLASLANAISWSLHNRQPEPFFGVWSIQQEGTQTAFAYKGRQFLIINPLDLKRISVHFHASTVENPLISGTARPFMGIPVRDLDRDGAARSEYLGAYLDADKVKA